MKLVRPLAFCCVFVMFFGVANAQWKTLTINGQRHYSGVASVGTKVFFRATTTIDVYDESNGTWSQLTPPHIANGPAIVMGTKVYFTGNQVVDVYDNTTGNWSGITLSEKKMGYAVAKFGTKIIFAGGVTEPSPFLGNYLISETVDIYDTDNGNLSTATLPSPGYKLKAITLGDFILFGVGEDSNTITNVTGTFTEVANLYNTTNNTWTTTNLPTNGVLMANNSNIGNKVFFSGFKDTQRRGDDFTAEYVSATNSWTTPVVIGDTEDSFRKFPLRRRAFAIINDRVFFIGGKSSGWRMRVDVYDNTTGDVTGTLNDQFSVANEDGIALKVGSKIYVAGFNSIFSGGSAISEDKAGINLYNDDVLPDFNVSVPSSACMGPVTFTASGAATYKWEFDLNRPTTSTVEIDFNTLVNPNHYPYDFTYSVTGTDADGYTKTKVLTITLNPKPTIALPASVDLCLGSSTALTATGADTYTWSPSTALSATTGSTVTANPTSNITYTVVGTTSANCSNSKQVAVTIKSVPAKPTAVLNVNGTVTQAISTSTSGNQWFFNGDQIDGATNQILPVFEVGDYSVQVTSNGCSSPMSDPVTYDIAAGIYEVSSSSQTLAYPNPVADYLNFKWAGFVDGQQIDLKIIDLTGRPVYEGAVYTTDCSIDATLWTRGVYVVHARQSGARQVIKIAKK